MKAPIDVVIPMGNQTLKQLLFLEHDPALHVNEDRKEHKGHAGHLVIERPCKH